MLGDLRAWLRPVKTSRSPAGRSPQGMSRIWRRLGSAMTPNGLAVDGSAMWKYKATRNLPHWRPWEVASGRAIRGHDVARPVLIIAGSDSRAAARGSRPTSRRRSRRSAACGDRDRRGHGYEHLGVDAMHPRWIPRSWRPRPAPRSDAANCRREHHQDRHAGRRRDGLAVAGLLTDAALPAVVQSVMVAKARRSCSTGSPWRWSANSLVPRAASSAQCSGPGARRHGGGDLPDDLRRAERGTADHGRGRW